MEQKRQRRIKRKIEEFTIQEIGLDYYKSEAFLKVKREQKERQQKEADKQIHTQNLVKRARLYGNFAIELFKPRVSNEKREEISINISKMRNPRLHKSMVENKFKNYHFDSRSIRSHRPSNSISVNDTDQNMIKEGSFLRPHKLRSLSLNKSPPMRSASTANYNKFEKEASVIDKSFDYLNARRNIREKLGKNIKFRNFEKIDWKSIISDQNLKKKDKIKKITKMADEAETKAKRIESLFIGLDQNNLRRLDMNEKVNEVFIGAIKAKLALLGAL